MSQLEIASYDSLDDNKLSKADESSWVCHQTRVRASSLNKSLARFSLDVVWQCIYFLFSLVCFPEKKGVLSSLSLVTSSEAQLRAVFS